MQRDDAYILDILNAARTALDYVRNKTSEDFIHDMQCQDAVIRRLEIIGEAAKRVSEETKQLRTQIPWRAMISMRNTVIHEYDGVDLDIIWNTVKDELPGLVRELEKLLPGASEA